MFLNSLNWERYAPPRGQYRAFNAALLMSSWGSPTPDSSRRLLGRPSLLPGWVFKDPTVDLWRLC